MAVAGFLAGINAKGAPSMVECVLSDNGTEFTKPEIVALLNEGGIRREYTPIGSPKHDGVVGRRLAMTLDLATASMASRLEALRLLGDAKVPPTQPLWVEACRYARDVINMTAKGQGQARHALATPEVPRESAVCAATPVLEAGFSLRKEDPAVGAQGEGLFLPDHHSADCCKTLLVSGRTSYSRNVTWEHPGKLFVGVLLPEEKSSPPPPSPPPSPGTPELLGDPRVWSEPPPPSSLLPP